MFSRLTSRKEREKREGRKKSGRKNTGATVLRFFTEATSLFFLEKRVDSKDDKGNGCTIFLLGYIDDNNKNKGL